MYIESKKSKRYHGERNNSPNGLSQRTGSIPSSLTSFNEEDKKANDDACVKSRRRILLVALISFVLAVVFILIVICKSFLVL